MVEVSVLMPVFNTATYLEEAIESVLAQSGPAFELLITDDGSSDESWQILQKYTHHPKVRLWQNEQNLGQGATRNAMARQAAGQFLTPCDSDDLLMQDNLQTHHQALLAHSECAAVYSGILVLRFDKQGRLSAAPQVCSQDYRDHWDLQENVINHGGCMLRKDRFLEAGGYEEDLKIGEDWGLWLRLVELAPLHYLPNYFGYGWRRHPEQTTQKHADQVKRAQAQLVSRAVQRREGRQVNWEASE